MSMSIEEAIRILDPETSADAIAEIEYYAGFNRDKPIEKVNEACEVACDVMREHLRDVETMFSDKECYEDLRQMPHEKVVDLFFKMKKLFNKACERCDKLEKENIELTDWDELIDSITDKRKTQCYKDDGKVWCYYSSDSLNPCGCGSNCYHYEFDGKKIYGVCNACDTDIYEMKNEFVKEKLKQGIWK